MSMPTPLRLFAVSTDSVTLQEFAERWLEGRRSLRESTRVSYETHFRLHINPAIGHIPLEQLTRNHFEELFSTLLGDSSALSQSTVVRIYATINAALNHAVASGALNINPAALVEMPQIHLDRPQPWNAAEVGGFLQRCLGDPDYPLFAALVLLGLRRGEALGLTWADVDLADHALRVRKQLSVRGGSFELAPPKSRAGRRTIVLDERMRRILYLRGCEQRLDARNNGWSWSDSTLVFTTTTGQPRSPVEVTRRFQRLTHEHGVRSIRLHDLRHTSASLGLASGETLLEVSRRLGHSTLAITADIYSQVAPESAARSASRLSDHVLGAP